MNIDKNDRAAVEAALADIRQQLVIKRAEFSSLPILSFSEVHRQSQNDKIAVLETAERTLDAQLARLREDEGDARVEQRRLEDLENVKREQKTERIWRWANFALSAAAIVISIVALVAAKP